jgi:two-component system OmpR family sensor kinase/two-component system sensor histidine kinase BaeS
MSIALGRAGVFNLSAQLSVLAVIVAIAGLILLVTFVGVMRRVGTPFGDIVEAADRVASGDFSTRVVERGPPPLRSVARAFNSMTGRLQSQDQQRRHLMADIAHELRTPLAVVQGRLEGLLDGVYPRDDERLSEVLEDTRILGRLIDDLRTLANAESGSLSLQKEPTDLAILIQDVANSFSAEASTRQVMIRLGDAADLPLIDVDPLRIREVLANVVSNALRHTPKDGIISVAAETERDHIVIRVTDTGTGIPAEELPKIFDRFYKSGTSRGSGLGLTIARNLVVAHGGEIKAESEAGKGTTIRISLPLGSS